MPLLTSVLPTLTKVCDYAVMQLLVLSVNTCTLLEALLLRLALTVPKIGPRMFNRRRSPNRQKFIEDQKTQGESRILEKYQTRDWRAGDIYTPHDLSAAEMKKWRKRHSPATDAFDSLNMNPLDLYKVCASME
jgi:hypothetical protein